ncbi:MAG: hypothetical protein JW738_09095 [Actinobacteria bacterium]|nr:hypothetical protein [Actinomycetota bacterium]
MFKKKEKEEPKPQFDEKTLKRAEFCNSKCPMCVIGRKKGKGIMYKMVQMEAKTKLCPWCRAYEKVYGIPAYEKHSE